MSESESEPDVYDVLSPSIEGECKECVIIKTIFNMSQNYRRKSHMMSNIGSDLYKR